MAVDYSLYGNQITKIDGHTEFKDCLRGDLIARLIYAEARGESLAGKQGVYWVFAMREQLQLAEFGYTPYQIIVEKDQFQGADADEFYKPTRDDVWKTCVNVALTDTVNLNPIGNCLWFNADWDFPTHLASWDKTLYRFKPSTPYKKIVEKVELGKHVFFRLEGDQYIIS